MFKMKTDGKGIFIVLQQWEWKWTQCITDNWLTTYQTYKFLCCWCSNVFYTKSVATDTLYNFSRESETVNENSYEMSNANSSSFFELENEVRFRFAIPCVFTCLSERAFKENQLMIVMHVEMSIQLERVRQCAFRNFYFVNHISGKKLFILLCFLFLKFKN